MQHLRSKNYKLKYALYLIIPMLIIVLWIAAEMTFNLIYGYYPLRYVGFFEFTYVNIPMAISEVLFTIVGLVFMYTKRSWILK